MDVQGVKNKHLTCKECKEPFQKKSRGWKRRRRNKLFPGKGGFYCERCFWCIAKAMSPSKKAVSNTKEHKKRSDHKSVASASPQMEGQQVKCAFCGRGEDATEICGKLYNEVVDGKSLAAHRKCMQYSAKLVQYTFESFGGFKIDKVQKEVTRGIKLKCHVCKCKTLNTGGVKRMTSAASGCAWPGCPKAFHFYCAAKSYLNSRRKRRDKTGAEFDVYSIFCCDAHKQKYIRRQMGAEEYSASESEEDDETRPVASSSDGQSLTRKSSASTSVRKMAEKSSDEGVQDSSSEDGGEEENASEEEEKEDTDDDDEVVETEEGDGSDKKSNEEDSSSNDGNEISIEIDHADEDCQYDDIAKKEDVRMKGSAYDPYKSLSTSSDSSDSDAELPERKDNRKTPFVIKFPPKPKEKSPKSEKKSPTSDKKSPKSERKKPEVLVDPEQGQEQTSYGSHQESDCFDTPSNKMEIADRIKMTPRGKERQEEHEEGASDIEPSSLPAKARRRLDDASEDSASQGFTSPTTAKKKRVSDSEKSPSTSLSKLAGFTSKVKQDVEAVNSSSDSESMLKTRFTKLELLEKVNHSPAHGKPGGSQRTQPGKVGNTADSKKIPSHDTSTAKKASGSSGKAKKQKTSQREDEEAVPFTSLSRQTNNSKFRRSPRDTEEDSASELPLRLETPAPTHAILDSTRHTIKADVHDGNRSSILPECVLVVPVDHENFQTVGAAVRLSLAEKYSVDMRHVHDWTSLAPLPLPQGCMYHYFNNIAIHLRTRDWAKLGQLLIDGETIREKFQHEYLQQVQLYEQGEESDLLREFVNTTQKMLEITFRKVEERLGCPVGEFCNGTQEAYLALAISDTSDPDKVIRTKLHAPANLFEWKRDTDFDPIFGGSPPLERMQWLPYELTILQAWLSKTVTHVFQSICFPNNVDMQLDFEPEELDAFSKIKMKVDSLQVSRICPDSESATDPVTVVLLFHKIDKEVLIFEHYLERILKRYIDENKVRHIICIIPSCNLKGRDRHVKRFVNNSHTKVKVSSAFDPTQRSVLFIIMEITTSVNT